MSFCRSVGLYAHQTLSTTEDTMAEQVEGHHLAVPGGKLYYEVRGSGPLLLVIGQPMTSAPFAPLAEALADDHTVVTYDPHGVGQSTVDDSSLAITPEVQADDLAHVIEAVGGGPADVFGSSGGAVAALALAVRHPNQLRTVIAHEPPVTDLLPDARQVRTVVDDIEDTFRESGSGAAWGKFISLVMHSGPVAEDGVPPAVWPPEGQGQPADQDPGASADSGQPPVPSEKDQADDELFFLRMLKPFTRYAPDVDALRSGGPRVVIGVGETSREEVAVRSAVVLADRLETPPTTFPGDHGGFMGDPVAFADRLRQVLAQTT
jgi:pimeloyl-ACP methyl ester carboxylesterase